MGRHTRHWQDIERVYSMAAVDPLLSPKCDHARGEVNETMVTATDVPA